MRVVLDTNVLISAYVFPGGPPEEIVRLGIEGHVELVTSPVLLAEFGRVLAAKFGWEPQRVEVAISQIARIAVVVRPAERVAVVAADPDDDRVLEAAAEGRVERIVSGDRHLLALIAWRGIPIERHSAFIDFLRTRE